ncbi:MAG: septation protein IspZ [Pseudomonadota bacterium]
MDKRLIVEVVPGPAFLVGYAIGGVFVGAGVAAVATGMAVLLRWRWDRRLPLFAMSVFALTLVLLAVGVALDDTDYIKMTNSIGSLAFAAIIAGGMFLRPSLLQRTLGYSLHMTDAGWRGLHLCWIGISILRAGANELVWRMTADRTWAIYNAVSDVAWIGLFVLATWCVAHVCWDEEAEDTAAEH